MSASVITINIAYIALVSATFTRTVPRMRGFLVAAAFGFITFGVLTQNWSMVAWNVLTCSLNIRQLVLYAAARRQVTLSDAEETYRQRWFPELDAFDFASLWSIGEDVSIEGGRLAEIGHQHGTTSLIIDGIVEVRKFRGPAVRLEAGALIGEMSLVSGKPATADVDAIGHVRVRQWSHERLLALEQLNPNANRELHRFIERDLTAKVR